MDAKELRELIEIISRSSFTTFELERDGFKLRLVKGAAVVALPPAAADALPVAVAPPAAGIAQAAAVAPGPVVDDGAVEMTSPIVGTFYRCPSPGAAPFVEVGDRVKKG